MLNTMPITPTMKKSEARLIPELQIHPDGLIEDCFYYRMAQKGKLPKEHEEKALERLKGKEDDPCYNGSFIVADLMIANIEKYGVACVDWCE